MAYRFSASGTLEVPQRHVNTVCSILRRKAIDFEREGNTVRVEHSERAIALLETLHENQQSLHSRVSLAGALLLLAQASRRQSDLDRARGLLEPLADQRESNIEVSSTYDELDNVQAMLDKAAGATQGTD